MPMPMWALPMSMSRTCWSSSFSASAFFVYASNSASGMYVPGHMLHVGCGSVGLTWACAAPAAIKQAIVAGINKLFFMDSPRGRSAKRIPKKQQVAAMSRIDHRSPQRIARRERPAHDEADLPVFHLVAHDLRRERQELLVHEAFRVEIADEPRAAFDEDPLARSDAENLVQDRARLDRARPIANRANVDRLRCALLPQALLARGRREHHRLHLARLEHRQAKIEVAAP